MAVWMLSVEENGGEDYGCSVIAFWQNRPTVSDIESLSNICVDEDAIPELLESGRAEDPNISDYYYVLSEQSVIQN